jgi:putative flippase GtrA
MGMALQFALLFLLRSIFHFNYLAAAALAVEVTVVHNFLWHERYTWADRVQRSWPESVSRMLRFNSTNGAVSIGGLALMKIMVGIGHLNYLAANAVAIVVCSLLNFWLCDAYVFERSLGTRRQGGRHTSRVEVANSTARFP